MERFLIGTLIVIVAIIVFTQQELMTENRKLKQRIKMLSDRLNMSDEAYQKEMQAIDQELMVLIREGKKVKAVKRYREITGASLVEANDYVEHLSVQHNEA